MIDFRQLRNTFLYIIRITFSRPTLMRFTLFESLPFLLVTDNKKVQLKLSSTIKYKVKVTLVFNVFLN